MVVCCSWYKRVTGEGGEEEGVLKERGQLYECVGVLMS